MILKVDDTLIKIRTGCYGNKTDDSNDNYGSDDNEDDEDDCCGDVDDEDDIDNDQST